MEYPLALVNGGVFQGVMSSKETNYNPALSPVEEQVKVQFTLEQATKAQRGSRGIALLFL
jgi:hypothetical protein